MYISVNFVTVNDIYNRSVEWGADKVILYFPYLGEKNKEKGFLSKTD